MKKIISFSIWGQDPKYLKGAIKNAELAKEIYPDWICRFYCGLSVPFTVINDLSSRENVELVQVPEWGNWEGLYWRFWPASEEDVDVVISRDTDSRLNNREKEAVEEWLSSDKGMHIMRDHPFHGYPVLGGMWGTKKGTINNIKSLIKDFSTSDQYGTDYEFWRQIGLDAVGQDNIMVHDEFFEKTKFPSPRNGLEFVGEVFDENENNVKEHVEPLKKYIIEEKSKTKITLDDFICYNYMPLVADHIVDISEDFYRSAGCTRLHNVDSFDPSSVKSGDIVFVKTDFIYSGEFQKNLLPLIDNKFILVSGISSYQVGSNGDDSYLDIINSDKLIKWFCTNPPNLESDKIISIPIGFGEKERLGGGDQEVMRFVSNNSLPFKSKKDKLFLPFHEKSTNENREKYIEYLKSLDIVDYQDKKLGYREYLEQLSRYKYIICLEGRGWDTHRNYEASLVGSVPVMKNSNVKRFYQKNKIPSLFVDDWSEINGSWDMNQISEVDIEDNRKNLTIRNCLSEIEELKNRFLNDKK